MARDGPRKQQVRKQRLPQRSRRNRPNKLAAELDNSDVMGNVTSLLSAAREFIANSRLTEEEIRIHSAIYVDVGIYAIIVQTS